MASTPVSGDSPSICKKIRAQNNSWIARATAQAQRTGAMWKNCASTKPPTAAKATPTRANAMVCRIAVPMVSRARKSGVSTPQACVPSRPGIERGDGEIGEQQADGRDRNEHETEMTVWE